MNENEWGFSPEVKYVAEKEYHRFVSDLFKPMQTKVDCVLHAAIGMSGEVGELFQRVMTLPEVGFAVVREDANIQEELGDIRFYMTAAMQELGHSEAWLAEQDVPTVLDDPEGLPSLIVHAAEFLDAVKKSWAYGRELDTDSLTQELLQIFQAYKRTCDALDLHDSWIRCVNVQKLSKRYPLGKYSDSDALARADKAEEAAQVDHTVQGVPESLKQEVWNTLINANRNDTVWPIEVQGQMLELHNWYHGVSIVSVERVGKLQKAVQEATK